MPLYTNPQTGIAQPLGIRDFEPAWLDSFKMGWRGGWRFNPSTSLFNMARVYGAADWDFDSDADLAGLAQDELDWRRDTGRTGSTWNAAPYGRIAGKPIGEAPQEAGSLAEARAVILDGQEPPESDSVDPGAILAEARRVATDGQEPPAPPDTGPDASGMLGEARRVIADGSGLPDFGPALDEPDNLPPVQPGLLEGLAPPAPPPARKGAMPVAEQEAAIRAAGLEGRLKPDEGYSREALEFIIQERREERADQLAAMNAPWHHLIPSLGGGLAAGLSDPLMLAACAIPIGPAAKGAQMIERAGSTLGRLWARAKAGAISGAAGAAMLEPLNWAGQTAIQKDYSCYHSLLNAAFGAGAGAFLHPLGGLIRDAIRPAPSMAAAGALDAARAGIVDALARRGMAPEAIEAEASRILATREIQARFIASQAGASLDDFTAQARITLDGFEIRTSHADFATPDFLDSFTAANAGGAGLRQEAAAIVPRGTQITAGQIREGLATLDLLHAENPEAALPELISRAIRKAEAAADPALLQAFAPFRELAGVSPDAGWTGKALARAGVAARSWLEGGGAPQEFAPIAQAIRQELARTVGNAAAAGAPPKGLMLAAIEKLYQPQPGEAMARLSETVRRLEDPGLEHIGPAPGDESRSGSSLRLHDSEGRPLDDNATLERLTLEDRAQLEAAQAELASRDPRLAEALASEAQAGLAQADAAITRARTRGELMMDYAQCVLR